MTNSKKAKRFQFWINVVLILITLSIVLPFVLVFISSLTDENTLIRNGYSFFPEKFSFYAYSYIIRQGEKILRAYVRNHRFCNDCWYRCKYCDVRSVGISAFC